MARADKESITEYLLGRLTDAEDEQVELRLLTDPQFAEEYDMVVNEITDDYVAGKFEGEELKQIEDYFFKSEERKNKLRFALALKQRKSEMVTVKGYKQKSYRPYLAIAASVLLVVGGFFIWRALTSTNEVDKGLAALQSAYRDERPLEARITNLDYAPYVVTRGNEPAKVNQNELSRAELTLLQALKDKPSPPAHQALGKVFLAKKEFDRAIEQFDEALKGDPNNAQLYSDLGAAWLEKGKFDVAGKEPGKGMQELGRSLANLTKALELNPNLLEARFNRALCRQSLKLPQAADDWQDYLTRDSTSLWAEEARKNLELLRARADAASRQKDELYSSFVSAYRENDSSRGWFALAQARTRAGNEIVQRLIDEHLRFAVSGHAKEANDSLKLLIFAGEAESAQVGDLYTSDLAEFYSRAAPYQLLRLALARRSMTLAKAQYDKSEFEAAIELYKQAAKEFDREGDVCEMLFAESWVGYCELRLADNESRKRFDRLAVVYAKKNYKSLMSQTLHAQSDGLTRTNDVSRVLDLAGKALEQAALIDDRDTKLRCLQQFVSMNLKLGNYVQSLNYGIQSLGIAQTIPPNPRLVWTFYHEAAVNFYWLNLTDAAFDFEVAALQLARESGWPFIVVRSHTQLGSIFEKRGEYEKAIASGLSALDEAQHISGEKSRLNIASHASMRLGHLYRKTGQFENALTRYDDALMMFERLKLGMFLYEAHKGKFMTLSLLGNVPAAEIELTETLELFEQHRSKIRKEKDRNSFFDVGQDTYDMAIDFAYTKRNDPIKAFDYSEQSRARSLLKLTHAVEERESAVGTNAAQGREIPPLRLAELQERLPEETQVLQFSVLDDKVITWVVSRQGIKSLSQPISENVLAGQVNRYLELIANDGPPAEITEAGRELYRNLILPIESLLDNNKQLCIVPDKILTRLPFSSLASPGTGRFFVEKFNFLVAASTNIFISSSSAATLKGKTPGGEKLLSIGNPAFASDQFPQLQNLPSAENEAVRVAQRYETQPLLGTQAQESRIRAAMPDADVIHFAAHFIINSDWTGDSGLVLAAASERAAKSKTSDGILQSSEIEDMKLPRTRLVVLSACQTGVEHTYEGEGAVSIGRSFVAAGVPLVVASLWPVESEATAYFMVKFHEYRKASGLSTVAALRKAQVDMLTEPDERYRSPHKWAAFVVFGGYADF